MSDELDKKDKPSEADVRLGHTVMQHVLIGGFGSLLIALEEASLFEDDDPRFGELIDAVSVIMDDIDDVVNHFLDTIPGTLTREEAEFLIEAESHVLGEFFPDGTMN